MIASNLSVQFRRGGLRTLQIGCDPKHDSTRTLMGGRRVATVMDVVRKVTDLKEGNVSSADFHFQGLEGIGCIEAGGPESGVGCAGLGVTTAFRLIEDAKVLEDYDLVLMDVLGDVVCGGFAAPMMKGLAGCVVIVVSETPMSLYAANNISKAVRRYRRNGAFLAGLVANNVREEGRVGSIEDFARRLDTKLLEVIPHHERILESERRGLPVSVLDQGGELDASFRRVADVLLAASPSTCPEPAPLSDEDFDRFFWEHSG